MSGLNDWLDLSNDQRLAILKEDLEERLAARRRRDAERALKFAPRGATPLDPPANHAVTPWTAAASPAAGGSNSTPSTEHIA